MTQSDPTNQSESRSVKHQRWADIPVEALNPKLGRHFIVGSHTMIARVLLRKDCVVPTHNHFNEQISYVLEGALEFDVEGQKTVVRAGEVLCIPPNVPHAAVALEDTVELDIFNPPREDWIQKTDTYLRV